MSTSDETQSEGQSETTQEPVIESLDLSAAVKQLRVLICGLGAGLLLVSLALSAFVYKQNRNLIATTNLRQRQMDALKANQQPLMYAVNELGKYSFGKPELLAIFARHGIQITSPSEAGLPAGAPK